MTPTPPLPPGFDLVSSAGTRVGLADVLRVRRQRDGAELTLTLLHADVSADERFRGYVLAVMDRLAHVHHAGIVDVLEHGEVDGRAWVLADPPAGRTVRELLEDGTIDPERAVDLFEPLARAMRIASEYGLQHRDLDAGNVLIGDDDRALLLEPAFIDALAIPGARESRPDLLTYVPPERLRLAAPDARTDVHLLGGLLLTALTAQPPGSEADRVLRDREREGAVPPELDNVLWRALAADPLQRPASPRDFFHQARRALSGEAPERFIRQPQPSVSGTPAASTDIVKWGAPGAGARARRRPRRRRLTTTISGWSTSAGRAVRGAGSGIGSFVGKLRPGGGRAGYTQTDRPAPVSSATTRPAGELEAPADDSEPHPAGPPAPAAANGGSAPPAGVAAAAAAGAAASDPAARLGEAAARLRRQAGSGDPTASEAAPAGVATASAPAAAPEPVPEQEPDQPPADPAQRRRAERRRRRRSLLVGVSAAAALAAGTLIVVVLNDGPETQEAPAAERTEQGPVTLTHPPQWQTVDPVPPVLGVQLDDPVALEPRGAAGFVPGSATLVAGTLPQTDASLLPPGLADTLQAPPTPEPIRVGDLEGYRYRDLAQDDTAGVVDLYVFGTDQGTLAVSCFTGEEITAPYRRQCAAIAGSLQAPGAQPVPLGPSANYGRALRGAVDRLNADRGALRRQLRDARTQQGQGRLADRLSSVYRRAGGRLASIDPPPSVAAENARIVRQLRLVADGYDRMASAARSGSRVAFSRGREQVIRRETQLDALLRGLREDGYRLN